MAIRFSMAFSCIILLLLVQGFFAYHHILIISDADHTAHQHRMRIKELELRLDRARLRVFKILGTMNPAMMDTHARDFEKEAVLLEADLIHEGMDPQQVQRTFATYREAISLHYDFRVRTAATMINSLSKNQHDSLVAQLQALSVEVDREATTQANATFQQSLAITVGLTLLALLVAGFWAAVLTRTLTDRRQAEKQLKASEQRFRALIEQAGDSIYFADLETGQIIDANPPACQSLGYTREELLNLNLLDIEQTLKSQEDVKATFEHLSPGHPITVEGIHRRKDGSSFPVEVRVGMIELGDRRGAMGLARDVTERNRLLEDLQHAHKMEAVGTLAGGVAHDFNNILNIILGNAELAMVTPSNPQKVRDRLMEIQKASHRARDVVRHLLTFSRKDNQKMKPLHLPSTVEDSLALLRSSLPSTIHIALKADADVIVMANPTQIHQVLINLCTNAVHAMKNDTGSIDIEIQRLRLERDPESSVSELEDGDYAQLTVRDDGEGIPSEILTRIFEPYFTTKEVGKGTGMGLAVAHGIIQAHKGAITVHSEPGKGTIFKILLPVTHQIPSQEKAEHNTPQPGMGRLLLVDDEEQIVAVFKERLSQLGYSVTAYTDPRLALAHFEKQPDGVDLVITDMTMPHLRGDRLTEEILKVRPDLPVIICSGYSDRLSGSPREETGARVFLPKPLKFERLAQSIQEILQSPSNG